MLLVIIFFSLLGKGQELIMGFEKPILIDAKDHLMGRLASTIAKCLLQGQKIIVVRCEQVCVSGNFYRLVYIFYVNQLI